MTVPPGSAVVCCTGVSVRFGGRQRERQVLRDVSCSVQPGQRIAVIGTSGSGKTTLLHVLAGLQRPTAGRVSWPALGDRPWQPGTVMVSFQTPSLVGALDVVENVALPLVLAGLPERAAREAALAALRRLDLDRLAGQLPEELSGGQAQRVSLARALAAGPRLLLADEPTGQVDSATAQQLVTALLAGTRAVGAALIVATHDPQVAARLPVHWQLRDGTLRTAAASAADPPAVADVEPGAVEPGTAADPPAAWSRS